MDHWPVVWPPPWMKTFSISSLFRTNQHKVSCNFFAKALFFSDIASGVELTV